MAKASGRHEQTGRDLVFRQWFEDNIERVEGGALELRSIVAAYRRDVHGAKLGRDGVTRILNELGVKRSERQGKPYRLGVGFKVDIVKGRPDDAKGEALVSGASWSKGVAPPPAMLRLASTPLGPESLLLAIPDASDGTSFTAIAINDVLSERLRQRAPVAEGGEGFDAAHDDDADPGAHERAAACYAYAAGQADHLAPFVDFTAKTAPREGRLGWVVRDTLVMMWPWPVLWWKPKTDEPDWKRRCLVRAGALIIAAIERHDRDKAREALADSQASQMTGV